jgi:thiamine pyrophosphate-dependent acetolactate synthase large subunit-like protein
MTTVADSLIDVLADAGVRHVFGIPGDAVNAIIDSIRRSDQLTFVHVRHEEAGAFAASAQAKLDGRLAAVVGTAGPGAIHLLNGLYDAAKDHAPVIAITGESPTDRLGTSTHQEIGQRALFADVAVFSQTVLDAGAMPTLAVQACQTALARSGVAHLAVPANMADQKVEGDRHGVVVRRTPCITPAPDDFDDAVRLLEQASAPVILAGVGARGAVAELLEFAERLGAPIIKTLRGKDLFADDNALTLGGLGLLGTRAAVNAMSRCDLLVMVGTDFPYVDFYPEGVPAIQLEVERTRVGRRYPVDVALVGHARSTLKTLLERVDRRTDRAFLESAQADMRRWRRWMGRLEANQSAPIKPEHLAAVAGSLLDDDAIITLDTGAVTAWVARHLDIRGNQRLTLSGNLASMAFGLPAAIGAQLAFPDRQVVAFVGDGSFTMLPSDLITAAELELPITVVVFDNRKLGLITLEQEAEGFAEQQTAIPPRNLAAIAEAFGARGIRVEDPAQLEGALREAFRSPRPTVVDVVISPDEIPLPPRIELAQALGFAEAKIKEFFGVGQDDEV